MCPIRDTPGVCSYPLQRETEPRNNGSDDAHPLQVDIARMALGLADPTSKATAWRGGCPGVSGAGPDSGGHQLGTSSATHFIGVGVPGAR